MLMSDVFNYIYYFFRDNLKNFFTFYIDILFFMCYNYFILLIF